MKRKNIYKLIIGLLCVSSIGGFVYAGLYPNLKYNEYTNSGAYYGEGNSKEDEKAREIYNTAIKNLPNYMKYKLSLTDVYFTVGDINNYTNTENTRATGDAMGLKSDYSLLISGEPILLKDIKMQQSSKQIFYHELGHLIDDKMEEVDNFLKTDIDLKSKDNIFSNSSEFTEIYKKERFAKYNMAYYLEHEDLIKGELKDSFEDYLKNQEKYDDIYMDIINKVPKVYYGDSSSLEYIFTNTKNIDVDNISKQIFEKTNNTYLSSRFSDSDIFHNCGYWATDKSDYFAEMFSFYFMGEDKYKDALKLVAPQTSKFFDKMSKITVDKIICFSNEEFIDLAKVYSTLGDIDSLTKLIEEDRKENYFLVNPKPGYENLTNEILKKLEVIYNTSEKNIKDFYSIGNDKTSFKEYIDYDSNNSNMNNTDNAEQGDKEEGKEKVVDPDFEGVFGWVQKNGVWYFVEEDGTVRTSSLDENGQHYEFGEDGSLKTGWIQTNGTWSYYNENGVATTGWYKDTIGNWYYLDNSGIMKTGWIQNNNYWYYLNENGAMKTGWFNDNGKWYYLKPSGAMATGWLQDKDGKWYYLYGNGQMAHNTTIDGYKLGSDGAWIK